MLRVNIQIIIVLRRSRSGWRVLFLLNGMQNEPLKLLRYEIPPARKD